MFKSTPVVEFVDEFANQTAANGIAIDCTAHFMVIDRADGPAHLLIELLSRLFEGQLAYVVADYDNAALDNLDGCRLLILGLEYHLPTVVAQVAQLPHIQVQYPDLKIMGIAHQLSRINLAYYQRFGLDTIVELPRRASELKTFARTFAQRHLSSAC